MDTEKKPAEIRSAVKQQLREDEDMPLGKLRDKIGCSMNDLLGELAAMKEEEDWE
jgi:hypothetical protein